MTKKPLFVANWKMNKTHEEAAAFCKDLVAVVGQTADRDIVICPSFTALASCNTILGNVGSTVALGAQHMHYKDAGAYTGEISPLMLQALGCTYVILGHSERREFFGETNDAVRKKVLAALNHGLIPIVCIGETLQEREQRYTKAKVSMQLKEILASLEHEELDRLVVAYEPIWAIGTGKTATPEQAQEVHAYIRQLLKEHFDPTLGKAIKILYGGSVKPENAKVLLDQKDIDGFLIGGASLDLESFKAILKVLPWPEQMMSSSAMLPPDDLPKPQSPEDNDSSPLISW
ncbi:triose-phosphate isomerase [Candidatus Woesearchaeota archaeon]|nr:triose-phosphate isomerase [Candidatus Woesearchaeota archaeon]